jgi:hypothetical protein
MSLKGIDSEMIIPKNTFGDPMNEGLNFMRENGPLTNTLTNHNGTIADELEEIL